MLLIMERKLLEFGLIINLLNNKLDLCATSKSLLKKEDLKWQKQKVVLEEHKIKKLLS